MADLPPLLDYSRSRAVVIGTWDYAHLDRIPAAEHSLRRMVGLLTGPLCGWPRERLLLVENEPGPGELPDRLITAFDDITDVALFYFVGHGQIAPGDQLCLGLMQSRPQANRRSATSLRFADVRQALQDSEAAVKVVILDCCFAGLATTGAMAGLAGEVLDLTHGTGAYTMAATSAYAPAWYQDDPVLARPQTYFTKYLVDLVEKGIPGQPSRLPLEALFKQLRENLLADHRPEPGRRAVNDAHQFAFAYNAAPPEAQRDRDREIRDLNRQLAEAEARAARAQARERTLRADLAERARELVRLRDQARESPPPAGKQQRQLQNAIQVAEVRRDVAAAAAHAAAQAATGRQDGTDDPGSSSRGVAPVILTDPLLADRAASVEEPRTGRAMLAEWALWGKEVDDLGYSVLRWSHGTFSQRDFHEVVTRYMQGNQETLPQYTIGWIPGQDEHQGYLAVGIQELADSDPDRSGGRARSSRGRATQYVRLFCVPYSEMARQQVSYAELVESVMAQQLPAGRTLPIMVELLETKQPSTTVTLAAFAEYVATLLLTTRPVCILGAEQVTAQERLQFVDRVLSLLPYGLRARLSASTWASATIQNLKLRLFFSDHERLDGGVTLHATWGRAVRLDLSSSGAAPLQNYANWLEHRPPEPRRNSPARRIRSGSTPMRSNS